MKTIAITLKASFLASVGAVAFAMATPAFAAELTVFGAEAGANADGSIPAYTGGIVKQSGLPTLIPNGDGFQYPNPFANEKPIEKITAASMGKYEKFLTPGAKALLKRLDGFRLDLYPTHRTVSYPQWVLDNTAKNAKTAKLVGDIEGDGVEGAYGGIPFPYPKNGYEVIWNHYLRWQPPYNNDHFHNAMVDSSGAVTDLGEIDSVWVSPYYDKNASKLEGQFPNLYNVNQLSPAAAAGLKYIFSYPMNYSERDQTTWFYSPGLRRVRLAPEYAYDTPIASYGGALNYDEIVLQSGRMDRFDYKLVGKKEMIIPYNCYRLDEVTLDQSKVVGPKFLNPDYIRWEKHRVWVVDATLKAGSRHVAGRRTFYVDEDSWKVLAEESYDQAGQIYRVLYQYTYQTYPDRETSFQTEAYGAYDMSKGNYFIAHLHTAPQDRLAVSAKLPNMSKYTPEAMAGRGVR